MFFQTHPSFQLFSNAYWIYYKYLYDPLSVCAIGRVDPLPHQLDAFQRMIHSDPIRFMIADDVGLGKTITTGLLLKEMALRGEIKKCLIIVPANLQLQWQDELRTKFNLETVIAEGDSGKALLTSTGFVITSLHYLRRQEMLDYMEVLVHQWDLILFDEAHHLANENNGYQLGQILSKKTRHLLLLTATPHDGKEENFFNRLKLLDDSLEFNHPNFSFLIDKYMIRRIKPTVKDFNGELLFPYIVTSKQIKVDWSEAELAFYREAEYYINNYYLNPETLEKYKSVVFILLVLMRRVASSLNSGIISLNRRLDKIEAKINALKGVELDDVIQGHVIDVQPLIRKAEEILSFGDDEENELVANDFLEHEVDLGKLYRERGRLQELIKTGVVLQAQNKLDSKAKRLLSLLSSLREKRPDDKIIIFTEYTDTLDYLKEILEPDYVINTIHGKGTTKAEKDQEAYAFQEQGEILIGTKSASEGLNLQKANIVINYELPWNPNQLQQRIGRVHRYGQTKPIFIFNFISSFSVEEHILSVLEEKIQLIRMQLGDIGVELLGQIFKLSDLNQIIVKAILDTETVEDQTVEIDQLLENKKIIIQDILTNYLIQTSLDTSIFLEDDSSRLSYNSIVTASDIERLLLSAFAWYDLPIQKVESRTYSLFTLNLPSLDHTINPILPKEAVFTKKGFSSFYDQLGVMLRFTFDKNNQDKKTDYLALGHPLVMFMLQYIVQKEQQKITLVRSPDEYQKLFLLKIASIYNNQDKVIYQEAIIEIFDEKTNQSFFIKPIQLWDIDLFSNHPLSATQEEIVKDRFQIFNQTIQNTKAQLNQITIPDLTEGKQLLQYQKQLDKQILTQKYEKVLSETEQEIKEYLDSFLPYKIAGLQQRKERLQNEVFDELDKIDANFSVNRIALSDPLAEMYGIPALTSFPELNDPDLPIEKQQKFSDIFDDATSAEIKRLIKLKREVELAGMKVVIQHERAEGRVPEDVSSDYSLGYDIKSYNPVTNKQLWIEVKASKFDGTSPIVSSNEMRIARESPKNYYLYVVYTALTNPTLHVIPNPANNLKQYITEEIETRIVYKIHKLGIVKYKV